MDKVIEQVARTMVQYWRAGWRGSDFHARVRDEIPACTLGTYNAAADKAWRIIQAEAT